nr:hypothetical protein [Tanacetum cinerariifolium]GEW13152.1 hypothetical protein [Tanacetum cinerariifolium]
MESVKKSIDERAQHKREYDSRKTLGQNHKSMIQAADLEMIYMLRMQISNPRMTKSQWLREYDLWSIKMEQYLTLTDHALWEVIVNGDSVSSVASASDEGPNPPKTAEQKLARKNKLHTKSTLMLAIPDEHLP